MARVQLLYTAPVYVEVDTETGEVTRVTVGDESTTFVPGEALDADTYKAATPAMEARAHALAESPDADWPSWSFGF